jgi:hypothetical protein
MALIFVSAINNMLTLWRFRFLKGLEVPTNDLSYALSLWPSNAASQNLSSLCMSVDDFSQIRSLRFGEALSMRNGYRILA